jgi:hypothetical protein
MSTALAIASVTAVLRDVLNNGLISHDVTGAIGVSVSATALPPDRIDTTATPPPTQLNLFLYQVTPNTGWRNVDLPSRDGNGNRLSNPPLALDLHYLLTAYGADELHSEILLGYGMQFLHETPVLARDAIRRSLTAEIGDPPALQSLSASELPEQVEQIKLIPEVLSTEEVSKLWAAFGTRYRPTASYRASVVLIQSRQSTRSSLPVRARNIYVVPFRHPIIDEVRSEESAANTESPGQPILAGHHLIILGAQLRGDRTRVSVGGIEIEVFDAEVTDTSVRVALPPELRAGMQGVQVLHYLDMGTPPQPHAGFSSNLAAFVLRPSIIAPIGVSNPQNLGGGLYSAVLDLTLSPAVGDRQRVVLFLNEFNPAASPPISAPAAYSFVAPARDVLSPPDATANISVPITGVRAGDYLVRVQVDGAESPLEVDSEGRYNAPQVTIP